MGALAREEIDRFLHLVPAEWDAVLQGVKAEPAPRHEGEFVPGFNYDRLSHHELVLEGLPWRPCVELRRDITGHPTAVIRRPDLHYPLVIKARGLATVIEEAVRALAPASVEQIAA
jgi:hypothetical protein